MSRRRLRSRSAARNRPRQVRATAPLAAPAATPQRTAHPSRRFGPPNVGGVDRHLERLAVQDVDPRSVGGRDHAGDPGKQRIALHLVTDFVVRLGDPLLHGGEADGGLVRAGGECATGQGAEERDLLVHGRSLLHSEPDSTADPQGTPGKINR